MTSLLQKNLTSLSSTELQVRTTALERSTAHLVTDRPACDMVTWQSALLVTTGVATLTVGATNTSQAKTLRTQVRCCRSCHIHTS